jgi:hypothetical protein
MSSWLNTPAGWRCSSCGHLHIGPISITDHRAHHCSTSAETLQAEHDAASEPSDLDPEADKQIALDA